MWLCCGTIACGIHNNTIAKIPRSLTHYASILWLSVHILEMFLSADSCKSETLTRHLVSKRPWKHSQRCIKTQKRFPPCAWDKYVLCDVPARVPALVAVAELTDNKWRHLYLLRALIFISHISTTRAAQGINRFSSYLSSYHLFSPLLFISLFVHCCVWTSSLFFRSWNVVKFQYRNDLKLLTIISVFAQRNLRVGK